MTDERTMPEQQGTDSADQILPTSYSGLALLGLLFFFLPWVNISCTSAEPNKKGSQGAPVKEPVFTQSGLDIVIGRARANEKFVQEVRSRTDPFDFTKGQSRSTGPDPNELDDLKVAERPLLVLFPLGLLIVLGAGLLRRSRTSSGTTAAVLVGACLAAAVIGTTVMTKFPVEEAEAFRAENGRIGGLDGSQRSTWNLRLFVARRTPVYWTTAGMTGVILVLVLFEVRDAITKNRAVRGLR